MGIAFMIVTGAILGWLMAFVLGTDRTVRGLQLNIGVGIAAALMAGLVISPVIGTGDLLGDRYSVRAIAICMIATVALLVPLNLLRFNHMR
ncbi:MAG: hypothetical protein JY451_05355 [Erythrobacter sp.]|nr:MAG: hypothetical protein JY451_05355 [Erythrobacter sp.]